MRAGEQKKAVPAVLAPHLLEHPNCEHPVLVAVVGTDTEDRLGARREPRGARRACRLVSTGDWVVDPDVYDARAGRLDEILGGRVISRVLGEEDDAVGRRQGRPRDPPEALPRGETREVRWIVKSDQVLMGQDQALAEGGQEH